MAALFGVRVIEKHFTDNKQGHGNDHYHAVDEADLKAFTERLAIYRNIYGGDSLDLSVQHQAISNARRRVVASRDLAVGHIITEEDLVALRSNVGIEIAEWDDVVGKEVTVPIEGNRPISWDQLAK
jgi:N-acetylneuraminate synthase